jgi:hypothetical protein
MKKTTPKRLVLCRETLRQLSHEQIRQAAAGGDTTLLNCPPPPATSDSVNRCCCAEQ